MPASRPVAIFTVMNGLFFSILGAIAGGTGIEVGLGALNKHILF